MRSTGDRNSKRKCNEQTWNKHNYTMLQSWPNAFAGGFIDHITKYHA